MSYEFPETRWYLYDNLSGAVILKHPYRLGLKIRCPHCGEQLKVERYTASCCGEEFKTRFGEIHQRRAVGEGDEPERDRAQRPALRFGRHCERARVVEG